MYLLIKDAWSLEHKVAQLHVGLMKMMIIMMEVCKTITNLSGVTVMAISKNQSHPDLKPP